MSSSTFVEQKHIKAARSELLNDHVDAASGSRFTMRSWAEDQENSVIVYGTAADVVANRETAEIMQKRIAKHGTNIVIPILSDVQALGSPEKIAAQARAPRRQSENEQTGQSLA